ncbi:MAG: hypothetical protein KA714_30795 [Limnoraphis sp. WC205]|nr:hypothetical protein [Limnoraphis sp. WC205]
MAVKKSKGLGSNPLSSGIFSKTDSPEAEKTPVVKSKDSTVKGQESKLQKDSESSQESTINTQESRVKSIESRFLNREQAELKGTNVRLPIELIDWVDDLVKQGSRDKSKSRIPKEVWFQAALELFQAMPVDWDDISDEDELKDKLKSLESRLKSL